MSHNTGTIQTVTPNIIIGPNSGASSTSPNTWAFSFVHTPAPTGTTFVILHFRSASFPANNRLEVDLGYSTDVFNAADGSDFWTRPINLSALPGGTVPIRYITDGSATGGVTLDRYGRGERLAGTQDPTSLSNSDPFLVAGNYVEPTYDPFWFCNTPPDWRNVACLPSGDLRRAVAQSVGMIITVHSDGVSTCSVTAIGPDTVITAGHCLADPDNEARTSSVVFGYQTNCDGSKPGGYQPTIAKVNRVVKFRNSSIGGIYHDYCILQLQVPLGGLGVPSIPLRNTLPSVGEQIFGLHHPNGAVKKVSVASGGFETVNSSTASGVRVDIDVSGGSSGSGLFDRAGRIVGVLSNGTRCNLSYFPTATILQDVATTPAPSPSQDVMLVLDRSGSMAGSAGTGQSKLEELQDAASLFVQLVRSGTGNQLGMVSFSTAASSPVDFGLQPVTSSAKASLVGPAPFSGGIVGGLIADGLTTIGGGLAAAQAQLAGSGGNPNTMLLMTDGLQNVPPMIDTVEASLAGTTVHAIGLGNETNLDGERLSQLAQSHKGLYTRAGEGLALRKFFALAFGDIFESGTLIDPTQVLPASQKAARPFDLPVCGEETITAVIGWDRLEAPLTVVLESPSGDSVTPATPGVEHEFGRNWMFLRVPLPINGDRDGTWRVTVTRVGGGGEFPPIPIDVTYFINVIANGGPKLRLLQERRRFYTGEPINPLVELKYADGATPHHPHVHLWVTRPTQGAGNILRENKLRTNVDITGDGGSLRHATLSALQAESSQPIVDYIEDDYHLSEDPQATGFFEHSGVFGHRFANLLQVEGNYTFRARATYGHDCPGMREVVWSLYVATSVDPSTTEITTEVVATLTNGRKQVNIRVTPRDRYGNYVGPGRGENLTIDGIVGSEVTEPLKDNGDGTYETTVTWDPSSGHAPGMVVSQGDQTPVCLQDPSRLPPATEPPHYPWLLWLLLAIVLILLVLLLI